MGCPTEVEIGSDLVFTVCTHVATTGTISDASSTPTYRLYEDTTGTPVVTGDMDKLDDANTTGFYSGTISCLAASGFENGKTYNLLVTAVVNAVTGCESYGFKAYDRRLCDVTALSGDITAADNCELFFDGTGYEGGTTRLKVDLDTIKGQAVTCASGTTILAYTGTATESKAQGGDVNAIVTNATYGNSNIKTLIDTIDGVVDKIEDVVANKITVTDATGATIIYADNSTTSLYTCTISDNSVTTTRTRLS